QLCTAAVVAHRTLEFNFAGKKYALGGLPHEIIPAHCLDTSGEDLPDIPDSFTDAVGLTQLLNYDSIADMNAALGTNFSENQRPTNSEINAALNRDQIIRMPSGAGVCAPVRLRIEQDFVQTRQGFDATLTMDNGSPTDLTTVYVQIDIRDLDGNPATDAFVVRPPRIAGFSAVDGGGVLEAGLSGTSTWTILPTRDAARSLATEYLVGGQIQYRDSGHQVTIDLTPASIFVDPQPELQLTYFHARDVIGDDPNTDEIESSQPFDLAVLVHNQGFGTANNLSIESGRPQIVENEKGLLIDFEIIESFVNGIPGPMALTTLIGDLGPDKRAVASWQLISTLQGLFNDYDVTLEHLDPSGDDRLSLITGAEVKELIRSVTADGDDGVTADGISDFLVNDVPDPLDLPDTLYTTDGKILSVDTVAVATVDQSPSLENGLVSTLTVPMPGEWGYVQIQDPSLGDYEIVSVTREDGSIVPMDRYWQTDRTFVGQGRRAIAEHRLHLLDFGEHTSYVLKFASDDRSGPQNATFDAVSPNPTDEPINTIALLLDEPIDTTTLQVSDLALLRNGIDHPLGAAAQIVSIDARRFEIRGLADRTANDAVYEIQVHLDGVQDVYGNVGQGVSTMTWVKGEAAPAIREVLGLPERATQHAVDDFVIEFTEAIDLTEIGHAISLHRDGEPV
ncbi:MAG: hypothetical protein AAFN70_07430, partial [Planctomycetota bacterium]